MEAPSISDGIRSAAEPLDALLDALHTPQVAYGELAEALASTATARMEP